MLSRIVRTWHALRDRRRWEQNLDDELRLHAELRAGDLERAGLSRQAAQRQARIELGSRERYKDEARAAFWLRWLDDLGQDIVYGFRVLLKNKAFTATAVVSLALGVGVNTVVFGILNTALFKPLPVNKPEQLFFVQQNGTPALSFPNYRDIRNRNVTLDGVVAARVLAVGMETDRRVERVWGYLATGNYFDVLGLQPVVGRFFHPEDDRAIGASPYIVLAYSCWQNKFHGDPGIVGRTVRLDSRPFTVVGVAPRGFRGTEIIYASEYWVPMTMQPELETFRWLEERANANVWATARIKPGITRAAAQADMDRIAADLAREYPRINDGRTLMLTKPGLLGNELRRSIEPFVFGVMILAGLVLLAACVNLASMLAARSADRMREIAVRISIGAGRARIVRQLLTESVLLTAIAGVGGSALAVFALRAFSAWRPPTGIALQVEVEPDWRVFLFAVLVSGAAGLLAGIAPARQAWRSDANAALKGASSVGGRSRRWAARDILLAAQVALCCVLVTASFVSLRGLTRALTARPGFDMDGASAISYDLAMLRYSREDAMAFDRRATDAAAELPGVVAVGYANSMPLSINQSNNIVYRDDTTDFRISQGISASYFNVSPGYFAAMGTHLLRGREFRWQDDAKAPAVAIVNEMLARRLTGTPDAVGRRVRFNKDAAAEIVAVVEDGKYQSLSEAPRPALFRPTRQSFNGETVLIVRSPRDMAAELEQLIARLNPALPIDNSGSLKQVLAVAFLPSYIATAALGAFGVLAAMLAVTGIYGIASYSVSRRRREIGIRMAIGARPGDVLRFVLGRTAILVLSGATLGLAGGIAASAILAKVVYQASSHDPSVLAAVALSMAAVGLASVAGPARKAVSVDPQQALRMD